MGPVTSQPQPTTDEAEPRDSIASETSSGNLLIRGERPWGPRQSLIAVGTVLLGALLLFFLLYFFLIDVLWAGSAAILVLVFGLAFAYVLSR